MALSVKDLHGYQKKAVNFQCSHPNSMLWMSVGLGKTSIALTSISHLLQSQFLSGVLVVAPIRVIRLVWRQEAQKWDHLNHLKFSVVHGTTDQRVRALIRKADVYLINYENLKWLMEVLNTYYLKKGKSLPFNGLVWDEVSKCKNSATQRVRAVRKLLPMMKWTTGLTGTPASNGYKDLHGQYLVVDKGERLGTSKTAFRTRFYKKVGPYKEVPFDDTERTIKELIGDITMEMSAEDYNPLPDLIVNDITVEMPENIRKKYDDMEKDFFIQLDSGANKEMFNQASLTNSCLQFANGAMYPVPGMPMWEPIHELKLDALESLIDEANGNPIFCAYAYRSDAERIMEKFKHLKPINLTACKTEQSLNNAMSRWKNKDCLLMIAHPACLHPATEVLTQWRGWVKIIDVRKEDKVFDGVEFVSHDGCSYSGYKDVIDLFGITMTPEHKLLIDGDWTEAKNVRDCEEVKEKALYQYQDDDRSNSEMFELWSGINHPSSERSKEQPSRQKVLWSLYKRYFPQYDRNKVLGSVAWNKVQNQRQDGQELRWSWNRCMRRVGRFHELLQRYVSRIFGRINHRENRCEWSLQQGELYLGNTIGTTEQQTQQQGCRISGGEDAPCGTLSQKRVQQNDADYEIEPWNDRRSSGGRCSQLSLRKERKVNETKADVYDLVNCGPRSCFLIRNDSGEMFISHNSAGHGIDALQHSGNTLVWFGLNWSLELYEQFNGRIRRQGQGQPVICHRILMQDTLDQAQALALDTKAETQDSLRKAIKQYRESKSL